MAAETNVEQSLYYAIAYLKGIREDVSLLQGMFANIKKWTDTADRAKKKIDSVLYELTGDAFYKTKEERNHS
jgi:hypothetical protein